MRARALATASRAAALPRAVAERVRELRGPGPNGRTTAIQTAKATLAAILAWYVAAIVLNSPTSWLAPVTAVLMVQSTVYRSVAEGIKRVLAVAAGVLLAALAGNLIGLNALGLLVVVPLSLLAARPRRVAAQGEYITVTSVLLLTFGVSTQELFLLWYVVGTAVGAVTGAVVNLLLFPPGYQLSAGAAVRDLAAQIGQVLRTVTDGVRSGWDADDADDWYRSASDLDSRAQAAESALGWARESRRWNPWLRRARLPLPAAESALATLWHIALDVRALTRSLRDTAPAGQDGEDKTGSGWLAHAPPLYDDLVPLLESVAEVVEQFGTSAAGPPVARPEPVRASLRRTDELYRHMAQRLPQAGITDPERFAAAGAILEGTARILQHLEQ